MNVQHFGDETDREWARFRECGPAEALVDPAARLWDDELEDETMRDRRLRHDKARAVCSHCPVQAECLKFGITTKSGGIFGGRLLNEKGEVVS